MLYKIKLQVPGILYTHTHTHTRVRTFKTFFPHPNMQSPTKQLAKQGKQNLFHVQFSRGKQILNNSNIRK